MAIEIKFQSDTAERKRWFNAASFAHPAKMHLSLQAYLIEHYTKPGEVILDPMAGSGTILVACALGRNVVCVELEQKFCDMMQANWEKIKLLGPMLGYKMGEATILQGDARNLNKLMVDKCIFSPPYAEANIGDNRKTFNPTVEGVTADGKQRGGSLKTKYKLGQIDKIVTSPPYAETEAQVSADKFADPKKFGEISAVISSPPHGDSAVSAGNVGREIEKRWGKGKSLSKGRKYADAVITSPPYGLGEGLGHGEKAKSQIRKEKYRSTTYTDNPDKGNIGNLKSDNYLEAMLSVYHQCHRVLRPGGLMCLVVKNFIRDKKIVRLDLDTIKLCEKAGFALKERLKRKLTQQSFWRIIYAKKFPDAPKIEFEDVLIFEAKE